MSSTPEELAQNLHNLNLERSTFNVALSSSNQDSRNTNFNQDFSHPGTLFFAAPSHPTKLTDNAIIQEPNPSVAQNFESLYTMPVASLITYGSTKEGSWTVQNILKMRNPEVTEVIFRKLVAVSELEVPPIFFLMNDQHGWHVFPKLVDACNEKQLEILVITITGNTDLFIKYSLTKYGACSLITLIKILKKSPLVEHIVNKLCNKFLDLMTKRFGLHVLTECLDQLDEEKNELLYLSADLHCLELATHKQGCRSLNRVVERIRGPHREPLIRNICDNAVFLSFDPSGNFVVQKVLELENPIFTRYITQNLKGKYASLSTQKSGSHLVEKCLKSTGMPTVVEDLITSGKVLIVAGDKFGNFVIQAALRETNRAGGELHSSLMGCIDQYWDKLQYGYGRNVLKMIVDEHISV